MMRGPSLFALAALLLASAPACTVNPATGNQDFTPLMGSGEEAAAHWPPAATTAICAAQQLP